MEFSIAPFLTGFFIFEWVVRIIMLFTVPRRRKPSSANAWLLLVILTPTLGAVLFYMFGHPKLPKTRRVSQRQVDIMTQKELEELNHSNSKLFASLDNDSHKSLARLATVLGGMPPMTGNDI